MGQRGAPPTLIAGLCLGLGACNGTQSALHPAGQEASDVAGLFWLMTGAGAVVWIVVMGITVYAILGRRRPRTERFADRFILVGGVVFPTVVLADLLVVGLSLLPAWPEDEAPDLRVHVTAEQFWWRVTYDMPDGSAVETANEIHLPLGTAEFRIDSPDVIHSFWIPALGGKMDAIPGRENRLRLTATTPGIYRGVCAEFCGASHALMAFPVVVHEGDGFADWLRREAEPATNTADAAVFVESGCGGCHVIRGVSEMGSVGPDLTHFGSRRTIGAGTLPNTPANLRLWLADAPAVKPGVHMPPFATLGDAELDALVAFLGGLR
ncbi:MAG: cytochrome c oxidase subunit II [Rhizobiales bacterium]|nr:cytochrome c oxidase subunit II [Hyphomicrobiales bacterium]